MLTMMNENNGNQLITNNVLDMGIDLFPVYQHALYGALPPNFEVLYSEYKCAIIEKGNNLSKEYIQNQIRFLDGDIYTPEELNIKNYSVRPEPEFLEYLLQVHYSFRIGEEYFNVPIVGVW